MRRIVTLLLLVAARVHADPLDEPSLEAEGTAPARTPAALAPDDLSPWSLAARHDGAPVIATSRAGYDASTGTAVMSATIEATLSDRLTLRAGTASFGTSTALHPSVGALVDVLRQEHAGLDLAVGGSYEAQGFNRVPAVVTRVALGRSFGATRVLANAALGLGTVDGERYGELELGTLHPLARRVLIGLDSRAHLDLERNADEPAGETDWDLQAGPVAAYALGRVAVSVQAGVSAWKQRAAPDSHTGAIGTIGLAMGF